MAEPVSEATSEELLKVAESTSEATFEEFLGTEEPMEAPAPENPKQKQPRRRRSRCRRHGCADSFATYFPRVLKTVHEGLSLSQEAVSVMDSLVKDIFQRIAEEASHLVRSTQRTTLTSDEIQTAVRLLLPGELGKQAISEAAKATSEATKATLRYKTGK